MVFRRVINLPNIIIINLQFEIDPQMTNQGCDLLFIYADLYMLRNASKWTDLTSYKKEKQMLCVRKPIAIRSIAGMKWMSNMIEKMMPMTWRDPHAKLEESSSHFSPFHANERWWEWGHFPQYTPSIDSYAWIPWRWAEPRLLLFPHTVIMLIVRIWMIWLRSS